MTDGDAIRLTLPRERRFRSVANLVLGGVALQRELSLETLEDLQLAVGALLDRAGAGGSVTVEFGLDPRGIRARVGPLALADGFDRAGAELDLRRVLAALVDEVRLEGGYVSLSKTTT